MGIFLDNRRMRVLLLIDKMDIGGAETHLLTLSRALIRQGVQVDVMCDGGAFVPILQKHGARCFFAPFRDRGLSGLLRCAAALLKKRQVHYTAVHAHTRYTATLAALLLPRIPLVTTVHLDFSLSIVKRLASRWGRRSLAVSEDLADYLTREYGVKRENIFLTKNGIDTEDFAYLPALGGDIVHLSRLDRDRSLCAHVLCAIAPRLHERAPTLKIRIYGDGDDYASVRAAAEAANRKIGREAVLLCGRTEHAPDALRQGRILIGVSRAALEGAAMGLPVILAGNDGYGGILTEDAFEKRKIDNFCCRECDKIEENALYTDILFLWEHRCYCEKLRAKIAALIRKDFSADAMARDAISAYRAAQRTALVGFYGYGNFGDEMMCAAIKERMAAADVTEVRVLSANGEGGLSRKRPLAALLCLRRCDTVLFGGGNLLQSETSARSFFYYALLLLLCRRGSCEGIGMGLGGFGGKCTERLCGRLLMRFRALSLRTSADAATALRLSPSLAKKLRLTCDVCLHLPEARKRTGGDAVLFIPRRRPSEAMLALIEESAARGEKAVLVVLFPSEDLTYATRLSEKLCIPLKVIETREDFLSAAEGARLCISERLHGAIFSLLCHLPCLLYGESEKNRAFADDCAHICSALSLPSPILLFKTRQEAERRKKEAEGCTLGFSEIIRFFRKRNASFMD